MSRLGYYLRRARELPPDEVLQKGIRIVGQTVSRNVVRWRANLFGACISDAQLRAALAPPSRDEGDLLSYLRSDDRPAFFITPTQAERLTTALRRHFPEAEGLTIAVADNVCDHVFDLLGSGPTPLGERIDWHHDFKSGYRWDQRTYYADIRYSLDIGHDIKVPWELSRSQHFATLGKAYWYTGDEKYAQEFVDQVTDWIEQNPPRFGVNWKCTMDVAIRVVNWLWGYYLFRDSPSLTDEFQLAFFKSLLSHGRHIISNLELGDLTSNHYLSDLVGLVYLGILFPQFKEAKRWREEGLSELWSEMDKQVHPDGTDFEASISYHRLVTELFLSPIILCQLNGIPLPGEVMGRLEKMLEFVMYYTKPDGTVPLIGDGDNGRLHRLNTWADPEREWVDHRYLLAIGAVLFERNDFAQAAGDQWEEAFWLLGEQAITFKEEFDRKELSPLQLESRVFPDGGLYIMRHADLYMIVDAGANGQNGNGGHAHNDTLSFELQIGNHPWIVDPGTYAYTVDYEARNLFRSTAFHNVVEIDAEEINRFNPKSPFRMQDDARPRVQHWLITREYDFFQGEHSGYERLVQPVIHRRQIYFDKRAMLWIVNDLLIGHGEHSLISRLHLSPSCQVCRVPNLGIKVSIEGQEELSLLVLPLNMDSFSLDVEQGWISRSYGTREEAPVIIASLRDCRMPAELAIALVPLRSETDLRDAARLESAVQKYKTLIAQLESVNEAEIVEDWGRYFTW